jgi:hypothetical protein
VIFAVVLLLAVLRSALAHRRVLPTAVLFLVAGVLVGDGVFRLGHVTARSPDVASLAELALFAVLFTDGMRVGWGDLRAARDSTSASNWPPCGLPVVGASATRRVAPAAAARPRPLGQRLKDGVIPIAGSAGRWIRLVVRWLGLTAVE